MQKSDKDTSIVLNSKSNYFDTIYNILSDSKKFAKMFVVDEKHLYLIFGIKKKLTNLLKELKASETISEIDFKKRKPRGLVTVLVFYMAWVKRTKRSLTNIHHLDLLY